MSYFDTLPIELSTQIVSYFKYVDLEQLDHIIEIKIDWGHLFLINLKQYYHSGIKTYNIENICKDLLKYQYIIDENTQEIIYKYFDKAPMYRPKISIDTIGYLLKNNFVYPSITLISLLDDVVTFLKFQSMWKLESYVIFLKDNSHNILRYIFESSHELVKMWSRHSMLWFGLLNIYENLQADLETTIIIVKYFKNDNIKLVRLYERSINCDSEIFDYILNSINLEDISHEHIIDILKSIFYHKKLEVYDTFIKVYHQVYKYIDPQIVLSKLLISYTYDTYDTYDKQKIIDKQKICWTIKGSFRWQK